MKKQYLATAAVFCMALLAWGTHDAAPQLAIQAKVSAVLLPCHATVPPGSGEHEPTRGNCIQGQIGMYPPEPVFPPMPLIAPLPTANVVAAVVAV